MAADSDPDPAAGLLGELRGGYNAQLGARMVALTGWVDVLSDAAFDEYERQIVDLIDGAS